jgi:hypothetical protein
MPGSPDGDDTPMDTIGPIRHRSRTHREMRPVPYGKREGRDAPAVIKLTRAMITELRQQYIRMPQGPEPAQPVQFKEALCVIQRWFTNSWGAKLEILKAVFTDITNLTSGAVRRMHSNTKTKNRAYSKHTFEELYKYVDIVESFLTAADAQGAELFLRTEEYEQNRNRDNNHTKRHRWTQEQLHHLVLLKICYDKLDSNKVYLVVTRVRKV